MSKNKYASFLIEIDNGDINLTASTSTETATTRPSSVRMSNKLAYITELIVRWVYENEIEVNHE